MTKILKVISIIFLLVLLCGSINVDAKTIKIHDHSGGSEGGGGGVSTLTLNNSEYYISIDEATQIGYLIYCSNEEELVIGTCEVIIIDMNNEYTYDLCISNESGVGTIVITVNGNNNVITETNGSIADIFSCGSLVDIIE